MLIKFTLADSLIEGHGRCKSIVNMWEAAQELRRMRQDYPKFGMTQEQLDQRSVILEIAARLLDSTIEDHVHAMLRSYIQDVVKE